MVGAAHRGAPLVNAAQRLMPLIRRDLEALVKLGAEDDIDEEIDELIEDLERNLRNASLRKNDTPLQMNEVAENMMAIRGWMVEFRQLAAIELSLDAPSLSSAFSSAPEIRDGYPRDLLAEAVRVVQTAADLRARLEDVGVDDKFVGRGRRLAHQLKTAIGKEDIDPKNLHMKLTRHYMKKGQLHALLKRVVRSGQYMHRRDPQRAAEYHLDEIEPPSATLPKRR